MKKGFTLIELLAVIVILAIIALIAVPIIMGVISEAKSKTIAVEAQNIERAAEYYLSKDFRLDSIPKYQEYYLPISEMQDYINNYKDEMANEYVIVKNSGANVTYYYTGRDKNPYLTNKTLKETIDSETTNNIKNVKVNGTQVNKVTGLKANKTTMKNWVWYSGQLWQVMETTDDYVKLITANSVTSIAYGDNNNWNTSWVRKWLNEIDAQSNEDGVFYNNLSRSDLLLPGRFCLKEPTGVATASFDIGGQTRQKVTAFTRIASCSGTDIATDKIGLMTFEDYVYALDGTNGITGALGGSYLDEDELSWTMTKYEPTTQIWHNYSLTPGHIEKDWNGTKDYGKGVRPVIYLSSNIKIEEKAGGNYGTLANPYRLYGEQTIKENSNLNGVTIGSYIYLSEENNDYTTSTSVVTSRLSYTYDKTKVRYRVIGFDNNGNIKVQRADVLRNLPSTIAINGTTNIPYYYKQNACDITAAIYTDCTNNNYYKPNQGSGTYAYAESENIGYYLNNTNNGYYNWLSNNVKDNIIESEWNLAVSGLGKDYVTTLYNNDYSGTYPTRTNDGLITTKIGMMNWGEMFSGNDLNIGYWYINRHPGSSSYVSNVNNTGIAHSTYASYTWRGVRPVFRLKSNIKITGGEGTPANPYNLNI